MSALLGSFPVLTGVKHLEDGRLLTKENVASGDHTGVDEDVREAGGGWSGRSASH